MKCLLGQNFYYCHLVKVKDTRKFHTTKKTGISILTSTATVQRNVVASLCLDPITQNSDGITVHNTISIVIYGSCYEG